MTFPSQAVLADRLKHIEGSPTLALAAKAKALAKAGKPVLDFTAGEPDVPTPEPIKQAGIRAIQANHTTYTPVAGIPELRAAIAASVNHQRQTAYQPSQTIVTCGTKHALFNVFQVLCQPGDEVIVFSPYWVSFPSLVQLSGATPVIVETSEEQGFVPDVDAVRARISEATKAIIVNSPSNPTGAVIPQERLAALARLARERNLIVVSDEIYDQLIYPPVRHVSIAQAAPELIGQTIIVGGVSKTYSMTGWRIGWAVGPQPWIDAMINVQSHSTSNPASMSQHAALAALTGEQASVAQMRAAFQERRERLVSGLNRLPGLRCTMPSGAFYAWCHVAALGQPAAVTAAQWLEDALVATVPGEAFGSSEFIRFSFASSLDTIDEGLSRLSTWLAKRGRR
ncbi:MAG: pyridoxal phosphate-dependent aminotransferase [Candidatus Omnitrophota bacterium]|nr:pyridoxal phosphate-dependent aminotransferase [Candidatus Omnitrophota bacterium]